MREGQKVITEPIYTINGITISTKILPLLPQMEIIEKKVGPQD
jgi:hypothetical protein